jgi:hypothetical protein
MMTILQNRAKALGTKELTIHPPARVMPTLAGRGALGGNQINSSWADKMKAWRLTMKAVSTILIVLGAFALAAALLSMLGTRLREAGIDIVAYVTSVPYTVLVGVILVLVGLWLRRRGVRPAGAKGGT